MDNKTTQFLKDAQTAGVPYEQAKQYLQSKGIDTSQGMFESALWNSGFGKALSKVPFAQTLINPALKGAETVAQAGGELASSLTNGGARDSSPATQFVSPDFQNTLNQRSDAGLSALQNTNGHLPNSTSQQIGGQGASQSFNVASTYLPAEALAKNAGSLIKGAPTLLKLVTPGGAGEAAGAARAAATKSGVIDSARDALTEFKQEIENKIASPAGMAGDPELQNAYGKIVKYITGSDLTPATLSKMDPKELFSGTYSPEELGKISQNLMQRFPYTTEPGGSLTNQVATLARDVFSNRAKEITPGLSTANKAYALHKTIEQNFPALAKQLGKYAAVGAGIGVGNSILRGEAGK